MQTIADNTVAACTFTIGSLFHEVYVRKLDKIIPNDTLPMLR